MGVQTVVLSGLGRNQQSRFHCLELNPRGMKTKRERRTLGMQQWPGGDRRNVTESGNRDVHVQTSLQGDSLGAWGLVQSAGRRLPFMVCAP